MRRLVAWSCLVPLLTAQHPLAPRLQERTFAVDGVERQALLHVPPAAATEPAPLVFVFHGHGGRAAGAARSFGLHELWPDAIVVYPQGLPTPGRTDPEGERSGWQHAAGEAHDRDLRFVDAMLAALGRELRVDRHRVHAAGHSNGGGFTYLLWATRGEAFASFAASATVAARALRGAEPPPRPVLHLAGRADPVVPFSRQERTIAALVAAQAAAAGEPWDAVPGATRHRAANGADVAVLRHDGGHELPAAAGPAVAAFFRATPRPNPWVVDEVRAPSLVRHVYASPAAGTEVAYHVLLPPDYLDGAARHPVLYWLHGSGGGGAGVGPLARRFLAAMRAGAMPACLVVFPNGLPNGMWCDSVDGRTPVETVLVGEIVPRIDRLFRTAATREGRLLEGFSMGGYGALRLAFAHPELFAAASSLGGGPLQPELVATPRADEARREQVLREVFGGDQAEFRRRSPWQLAAAQADRLRRDLRLRLVVGSADATLPANRALHQHLEGLGIPHEYIELDGVPHDPLRTLEALGARFAAFHRAAFADPAGR
ncbi:MAG: hypothetical protein KF830_03405 [Planctomycetes bacterium]|nr:hypothetical protein [Planctomycetota bacterium]